MDEPTNHLDLDMVEWLEEMLSTQKMTLLLVTHDRYFLNNVTNQIVELESGQLRKFRGNFEYYLEKKAELESQQAAEVEKAQKQYAKELTWLKSQPKARGTKAKSRIDKANRLKEKAQQETSQGQVNMNVQSRRMGKKVLDLRGIHKQFDDKVVLDDFSYEFQKGDRIGIVGPNGAGKTTFLNLVTGALQPDKGERETGETIVFGYYKQEGMNLPDDKKVIEVVRDVAEVLELGNGQYLTAFQLLEQFLFPKHMHYNHVYKLSGGERRRLHLLTVLMQNPNFLILDEPTNDLDILTLGVLEDFLTNFQGCLITVTHDRYFLDKLVNHIFVFEGTGKVVDYNGTYQQYRAEKKSREQQQEKATAKASKPKKQQDQQRHQPKLSYKQQKELENLEAELQELEKRKAELQQKINAGDASPDDLQAWSEELGEIQHTITDRETRWLELAEMASFS
jgi:ATP-binding cassette subfamily F protein uup